MCFLEKVNPKQVHDNAFAANQTVNVLKKETSEGRGEGKREIYVAKESRKGSKRERVEVSVTSTIEEEAAAAAAASTGGADVTPLL